jgi:tetratricopeptide (TPR) repeat protein
MELGGLPLALEMAGAYLLHRPVPWQQYLELLTSRPREALPQRLLDSFTRHEADLYATLRVQETLLEKEPHFGAVLDLLTWSGSASMGISLLSAALDVAENDLLGALSLGVQLRLLDRSIGANRYGIHRLLRKVRQEERPLAGGSTWIENVCRRVGDWFSARRRDFTDLPAFEAEIDHLDAWRERATVVGSAYASRLTWLLAYPPYHRGQYTQAKRWIETALSLFEAEQNQDRLLEAWLWNDLAFVTGELGQYSEAHKHYERSCELGRELPDDRNEDYVRFLIQLAMSHSTLGNTDKALAVALLALEQTQGKLVGQHPDRTDAIAAVGMAYGKQGNWTKALELTLGVLERKRQLRGEDHPDTAGAFMNIALIYREMRDYERALAANIKGTDIMIKVLGLEHPQTADGINDLGRVYFQLGKFDKALEYAEKALRIRSTVRGERHPDTAMSLMNVGSVHLSMNNAARAFELYGRALEIRREILGQRHQVTIATVLVIARQLVATGHHQEAFRLITPFVGSPPSDPRQAREIKELNRRLREKSTRPGFRKRPGHVRSRGRKKRGR